ncbi:YjjW family glycine radical enzyme activase [Haloimpatiens sp. FM7315]|uniref:YjjW family glycine radical enzyme activase n=1 Tax=Haloimpatiens sp. FM7315 TaxID=3298609 RepID=UPI0035A3C3CF
MNKALVNKIIPFSSVDGPGNRLSLFLQGCNFNCLYCHNPETINRCVNCKDCVKSCPTGALYLEGNKVLWNSSLCIKCDECIKICTHNASPKTTLMTVNEIIEKIKSVLPFISGITVSGGECSLQSDFLVELFAEVKKLGITCFMDTNASTPIYNNQELLKVLDKAMIDLKAYDNAEHLSLTGMSNETVLRNIKILASLNKLYEIRTVIVPDLLNNRHTVDMTSKLISSIDNNIIYKLIKYRPLGVRENLINSTVPSMDLMNSLSSLAKKNGCKNVIIL